MNFKMIFHTIGNILKIEALLLILPLIVSLIYQEGTYLSFIITIATLLLSGFLLTLRKPKKTIIYAREGFVIVGASWIIMSLFGALPFVLSGEIPNFIDAIFETVSGFTTTGATILKEVEPLSNGMLFWRSFTHWIGGMGVLVFVLAILPNTNGDSIHLLRAESPGPQVGKIVSKVRFTARILYCIYVAMTMLEIIFLVCGEMNLYEAIVHSFSTAGTGGFGIKNDSIASYSVYSQIIITIFMILFGINFNMFYLLLLGNIKSVLKNEELRWYFGIILISTIIITLNIVSIVGNVGTAILQSIFQVSAIITTTGFATADFEMWPALSQTILMILLFMGASAGSTGGGLKVSRIMIIIKSIKREIKTLLHPKSVTSVKFEGKPLDESVVKGTNVYFLVYIIIFVIGILIISIDNLSFTTNFTAIATCINNVGPGLDMIGPTDNFSCFSGFSKLVLSMTMLIGRLEIFPILMLFNYKTYTNK